jgi:hypothetical protein
MNIELEDIKVCLAVRVLQHPLTALLDPQLSVRILQLYTSPPP